LREQENSGNFPLHWSITSCNKLFLLSEMFDSFMVKFYWNKILGRTHISEQRSLPVLDYLINLFITIKGFSIARKEKNRLTKKVANKFKKSKSMMGSLKSCSGFKSDDVDHGSIDFSHENLVRSSLY
jgi:ATP/ADP translocase